MTKDDSNRWHVMPCRQVYSNGHSAGS